MEPVHRGQADRTTEAGVFLIDEPVIRRYRRGGAAVGLACSQRVQRQLQLLAPLGEVCPGISGAVVAREGLVLRGLPRFVVDDHELAVAGLVYAVDRTGQPDLPARQIDRKGWLIIAAEGMLDVPWDCAARGAVRVVSDQHLAKLPPPPLYLNRPRRGPAGLAFGEHPVRLLSEHLLRAGVLGQATRAPPGPCPPGSPPGPAARARCAPRRRARPHRPCPHRAPRAARHRARTAR